MDVISAQNMDNVLEDEVEKKVQQAIKRIAFSKKLVNCLISTNRKGVKKYVGIYVFGKRKI